MSSFRVAYVDGRYEQADLAQVAIEDRGFQFADGAYDVAPVVGGRIVYAARPFNATGASVASAP